MYYVELVEITFLGIANHYCTQPDVKLELTLYPILCKYSTISGIASELFFPPDARRAERTAALLWRELRASTASL